jgi:hypothetical protein
MAGGVAGLSVVWLVVLETGLWPWKVGQHVAWWVPLAVLSLSLALAVAVYLVSCWSFDMAVSPGTKIVGARRAALIAASITAGYNPWGGTSFRPPKEPILRVVKPSLGWSGSENAGHLRRGGRDLRLCREVAVALCTLLLCGDEIIEDIHHEAERELCGGSYVPLDRLPWVVLGVAQRVGAGGL